MKKNCLNELKMAMNRLLKLFFTIITKVCACLPPKLLKDDDEAEEIVQDLFVKIWEKRNRINIEYISKKLPLPVG